MEAGFDTSSFAALPAEVEAGVRRAISISACVCSILASLTPCLSLLAVQYYIASDGNFGKRGSGFNCLRV